MNKNTISTLNKISLGKNIIQLGLIRKIIFLFVKNLVGPTTSKPIV